ncbi:hypothetical protein A3C98_05315 [Candidatus Roizmanbacteria bacterium RIFCSPHIGHO2_02_FULL_37_15]|uniref:Uncharacterized protein n=1 Tax=Candidatus Roizmanbacteria bacterium RIFCSPLOWO2_01_FULL_37_16 TaxID=1802058 RepID=A0A1F7ILE5_9BACT|nr:MAG: hypothetical protein A2859_03970 [Candidatus Roizmanbacteria bacterium RIFCSPHIGHO2_01_FULL_37_16b]OGK22351.1 MAG: hypothetical protein A3C98_05315 [Candidatus Roizmanbacteria bacterium RIFCSPHIGHO2_02_FULL_37_15]OGK33675.1 MAG: hypothetical protein A3F57_04485 [Candidatus Roizmanbacteria bacterium RIFCSPHIGHO2_12_FULL_36_11]OGK44169.1 MAG: hypothetical protein A3B40_04820 [Candidatus Roizmanbacteria bacterium RIFCSPLOWO2_01_FULL_37_16]OGK57446.1 MAG: hypothetical protein A3I50_03145 [C
MIERASEFTFRDHYLGKNIVLFFDRKAQNQSLLNAGLPITIEALDVLISLRTLPPVQRTFEGILDDMVTLTSPEGQFVPVQSQKNKFACQKLTLLLDHLSRKKMLRRVDDGETSYKITKAGKVMLRKAREVFAEFRSQGSWPSSLR